MGPPRPGKVARPVGSRIALDHARETGANFLSEAARAAAAARSATKEPHQSWDAQRLWADLLSSSALAFNLFGDLAADPSLADRVVHAWWPDVPGRVSDVRFSHSPGRLDPSYLGNLLAFDVAVLLDLEEGGQGVLGVTVAYHDRTKRELPKPERLPRYLEVAARSEVFGPAMEPAVVGTPLLEMWLGHLLVLSMLQHPSGAWRWGRYVVVHPAGNADVAGACARYRELLVDGRTFASATLEDLLDADALPAPTAATLRGRYLPTGRPG
jgi:hypothetical protein